MRKEILDRLDHYVDMVVEHYKTDYTEYDRPRIEKCDDKDAIMLMLRKTGCDTLFISGKFVTYGNWNWCSDAFAQDRDILYVLCNGEEVTPITRRDANILIMNRYNDFNEEYCKLCREYRTERRFSLSGEPKEPTYNEWLAVKKAGNINGGIKLMRVVTYFTDVDGETIWAYVENQGRACWYGIKEDLDEEETSDADILAIIGSNGFDPATLPHIEDQDKAVQSIWRDITDSENNMWFVEMPEYTGGDDPDWIRCGLTKEEFERQVDTAIKKYHLEDVIVKNEDETLYTCYGDFQSAFSEAYSI